MILTDYYRFERLEGQKSRLRIDCTASTGKYDPLEGLRNKRGQLAVYVGDNRHTKAGRDGRSDIAITHASHISSVFVPDPSAPYWYGDYRGTSDALLMVCDGVRFVDGAIQAGGVVEVFVARGQRGNRQRLYNMLVAGELGEELQALRGAAK